MISVRLSEEEYADLTRLCSLTGARSVSDLTRDAMHDLLRGLNHKQASEGIAEDLHVQIKTLNQKVEELMGLMELMNASKSN